MGKFLYCDPRGRVIGCDCRGVCFGWAGGWARDACECWDGFYLWAWRSLIFALLTVPCICSHSGIMCLINIHLRFVHSWGAAVKHTGKGISSVLIPIVNTLLFVSCTAVNDTGLHG